MDIYGLRNLTIRDISELEDEELLEKKYAPKQSKEEKEVEALLCKTRGKYNRNLEKIVRMRKDMAELIAETRLIGNELKALDGRWVADL